MGTNKLLEKIRKLLETESDAKARKTRDALKSLLKKLKKKNEKLKGNLAKAEGAEKERIEEKIHLVRAHRKKIHRILRGKEALPDQPAE